MAPSSNNSSKSIASNRRALRDYTVLSRHEAGIALRGTEVKSLRLGHVSTIGSFASIEQGELFLNGLTIQPYEFGNRFNHDPDRPRRLLMHRQEIVRLRVQVEQKGLTLIPLKLYFKKGRVKVEIGVCRGKRQEDKRETLRRRTADREAERAIANRGR